MRTFLPLFSALALSLSLVQGCSLFSGSKKEEPATPQKDASKPAAAQEKVTTDQDKALIPVAEQCLDSILKGLKDKDYASFSEHLVAERKEVITKDKFKQMADSMRKEKGVYQSRVFIGSITKNVFKVFFWKAQYAKIDPATKKEVVKDVFVTLTLGFVDGRNQVFGMSFQ